MEPAQEPEYRQAQQAYLQGNYAEAAELIKQLIQKLPEAPISHLLKGNIYRLLQQDDVAQQEYRTVLDLTEDKEIIDCAIRGLEMLKQAEGYEPTFVTTAAKTSRADDHFAPNLKQSDYTIGQQTEEQDLETSHILKVNGFDFSSGSFEEESGAVEAELLFNPFNASRKETDISSSIRKPSVDLFIDPFAAEQLENELTDSTNPDSPFTIQGIEGNPADGIDADSPFALLPLAQLPEAEADHQQPKEPPWVIIETPNVNETRGSAEGAELLSWQGLNQDRRSQTGLEETLLPHENHLTPHLLPQTNGTADKLDDSRQNELPETAISSLDLSRSDDSQAWAKARFSGDWRNKRIYRVGSVGVISGLVVAAVGLTTAMLVPQPSRASVRSATGAMAVAALVASGGTTLMLGMKGDSSV